MFNDTPARKQIGYWVSHVVGMLGTSFAQREVARHFHVNVEYVAPSSAKERGEGQTPRWPTTLVVTTVR